MKRLRILWRWPNALASGVALVVNAIQLSEVADEEGYPARQRRDDWENRARLVAFEGGQVRRHLGFLE